MANSTHPMYYTEAHYRSEVDKTRWGTTWGLVGGAGATVGAAHMVGKMKMPTHVMTAFPEILDGKIVRQAELTQVPGGGKTVNEAINAAKEGVKNGADDAAKAVNKAQLKGLRAGKWGVALAGGALVGSVAAGVGGAVGKVVGTFKGPDAAQADSWAAKEDARRSVTVNLENAR